MKEIIVTSQIELDALPTDFDGRIIIKFGTPYNRAVVNRRFKYRVVARENSSVEARENSSVVARENSSVEAWGNSSVVARENSSVVARENSSVVAWENSSVVARENSSVEARENSSVVARENSSVEAWGNSSVVARENSSVVARENSSVVAWENSSVVARENSSVEARENSSVVARENSSVEARENSSVVARGNTQVVDSSRSHNIKTSGNSRIVYNPKTAEEYLIFHGIDQTDGKAKLYKAVHKHDGRYFSDNDRGFEYVVGCVATADYLDNDPEEDCGHGIHMSYKEWAVDYGKRWSDLAIIEVEADVSKIVVPTGNSGKVRTDKVTVIREVPLSDCGLIGKWLSKKQIIP